jgi:hypothetical protein
MAKIPVKKKTNNGLPSNKRRENAIKNCTHPNCGGNPETKSFTAEPFQGQCCKVCLEVVSYETISKTDEVMALQGVDGLGLPNHITSQPNTNIHF